MKPHDVNKKRNNGKLRKILLVAIACGVRLVWYDLVYFRPTPTSAPDPLPPVSDQDWNEFQQDYQHRFAGRMPPPGMKLWLTHARTFACNERDFYQAMDDELEVFRTVIQQEGRKFQWEDITPTGLQQTTNYMAFTLHNHQLDVSASRNSNNDSGQQRRIEELLRWILEPVRVHVPPLNATYFFNTHDNPSPAKNTTKRPIFSSCKQAYWTENQPPPPSGHAISLEQTVQQQAWNHDILLKHPDFPDSEESIDIMVPWHYAYDPNYYDNYRAENPKAKPFLQRKERILWRGSTTGLSWGESPRFRLINQYGGTTGKAYPLNERTPVIVDFAFVSIVQKRPGSTLAPLSRLAGSVSFSEAQDDKYIMDVDGNGTSIMLFVSALWHVMHY
jgi:hypothetical protein